MSNSDLDKIFRLKDEKDWVLWKFQITITLKFHEVYEYVTGEAKPPSGGDAKFDEKMKAFNKSDIKAQRAISSTVEKDVLLHIVNCKTAAEMWMKLLSVYEQKSETNVHILQEKFFTMKKDPSENMATFISKLQEIIQQLNDQGEKIKDKMLISRVLTSLPPSLNHFHSAWQATEESKRTLNEFCARLMAEETRLNSVNESGETSEVAFVAKRSNFRKDTTKNKGFEKSRKRGNCYRCGSNQHWRRDCKEPPKANEKERGEALCCDAFFTSSDRDAWYLDSGATEHMTGRREWFIDYFDLSVSRPVRIGNGDTIEAVGKGDIHVLVYNGTDWIDKRLVGVWYVPNLFVNLFSQGKCLDKGYTMEANSKRCVFKQNERIVAVGERQTSLYKMLIQTTHTQLFANVAVKESLR